MSKLIRVVLVVVVSAAAGYGAALLWGTATAGYIVGVVGAVLSGAALVLGPTDSRRKILAKVKVGRADGSEVIGVDGADGTQDVASRVRVDEAKDSTVIGVRQRRP